MLCVNKQSLNHQLPTVAPQQLEKKKEKKTQAGNRTKELDPLTTQCVRAGCSVACLTVFPLTLSAGESLITQRPATQTPTLEGKLALALIFVIYNVCAQKE